MDFLILTGGSGADVVIFVLGSRLLADMLAGSQRSGITTCAGLPDWWNRDDMNKLIPYKYSNADEDYFRYLWYNPETQQAYYWEFST